MRNPCTACHANLLHSIYAHIVEWPLRQVRRYLCRVVAVKGRRSGSVQARRNRRLMLKCI